MVFFREFLKRKLTAASRGAVQSVIRVSVIDKHSAKSCESRVRLTASDWHKSPDNDVAPTSLSPSFTAPLSASSPAVSAQLLVSIVNARKLVVSECKTGQTTRLPLYRISGGLTEFLFSEWPPVSFSLCPPASVGTTSWFLAACTSGTC